MKVQRRPDQGVDHIIRKPEPIQEIGLLPGGQFSQSLIQLRKRFFLDVSFFWRPCQRMGDGLDALGLFFDKVE